MKLLGSVLKGKSNLNYIKEKIKISYLSFNILKCCD